jgi:RNA polymerase sigma factor (sigma-70 family)
MVNKYEYFIAKKIRSFNLIKVYEDIYQESLMVLYKSCMKFDESFNKSFMRFFELNLNNRFISLKNKDNKYGEFLSNKLHLLCDNLVTEAPKYYITDDELMAANESLSSFEKEVFQLKIINKNDIKKTAEILKCSEKKIYNALDRIKKKIKLYLMS